MRSLSVIAVAVLGILAGCSAASQPTSTSSPISTPDTTSSAASSGAHTATAAPTLTIAPTAKGVLTIQNFDGPDVSVRVNGENVGTVVCTENLELDAQEDGLPPLPWTVELIRSNGSVYYQTTVVSLPWYVILAIHRGHEALGPISLPTVLPCDD